MLQFQNRKQSENMVCLEFDLREFDILKTPKMKESLSE